MRLHPRQPRFGAFVFVPLLFLCLFSFIYLEIYNFNKISSYIVSTEIVDQHQISAIDLNTLQLTLDFQDEELTNLKRRVYKLENMANLGTSNLSQMSSERKIDVCINDPLDDSCENGLSGFDFPALAPETALMCSPNISIQLAKNSEFRDCDDPSCIKCREKYIDRTKQLAVGFFSQNAVKYRLKTLENYFHSFPSKLNHKIVIVCAVNYGQLYLFLNWACSCLKNNVFDPRQFVYVVPTDMKSFEIIKGLGFHAERPSLWLKFAPRISENYKGGANVGGHSLINNLLAFTTNFFIQRDYNVLLMDVDIVFLQDPLEYLADASSSRDVLGMYSPRNDQYGFMNSGFLFMRSTRKSKYLLQAFENLSYIKKQSDQQLWNSILRHKNLVQLEQRILPRYLFFTLWKSTTKHGYDDSITKLIHAVSVGKAKRLVDLHQWYFVEECQFFNKELDNQIKTLNLFEK